MALLMLLTSHLLTPFLSCSLFLSSPQVRIIDKVRKEYTTDPEFTPANAAKASSAAEVS
jgi:hypothetical protein